MLKTIRKSIISLSVDLGAGNLKLESDRPIFRWSTIYCFKRSNFLAIRVLVNILSRMGNSKWIDLILVFMLKKLICWILRWSDELRIDYSFFLENHESHSFFYFLKIMSFDWPIKEIIWITKHWDWKNKRLSMTFNTRPICILLWTLIAPNLLVMLYEG